MSARHAYPIIIDPEESGFWMVYIPDIECNTQGVDLGDAIFMARDCLGLMGCICEDEGKPMPKPSKLEEITVEEGEIVTLVDIDFVEYRRNNEIHMVRKNVTIPKWLNVAAEKAGINFSQTLRAALREKLGL